MGIEFTPEDESEDEADCVPSPTVIACESGTLIFPLGVGRFSMQMVSAGLKCDALWADDDGDLMAFDAERRVWQEVAKDEAESAPKLVSIGPKRAQ